MMQVGLLLPDRYKLLSIAAILEVMESANRICTENGAPAPFRLSLLYAEELPAGIQSAAFDHPVQSIYTATSPLQLILIPSFSTNLVAEAIQKNRSFIPWLIRQYQAGAELASFCTGAYLLGATGLLDGKIATTHVDAVGAFATAFPGVQLRADKTVTQDGRLYTSGGATSTFHLLLHLLQIHCGKEVAVRAAKIFAIDMDRDRQSYFSTFLPVRDHNDDLVAIAQQQIEERFQEAGTIEELIRDIPSSRRNIVRRFKQVTGITPIEYLQQTRIEAAKKLLEQTGQQMTEIMLNSGYNDPKAFRKIFRKAVGMTPSEYREKFRTV